LKTANCLGNDLPHLSRISSAVEAPIAIQELNVEQTCRKKNEMGATTL
jgi:hypothetical protein